MTKRTKKKNNEPLEPGKALVKVDQAIDLELDDLYTMLNYMRPAGSKTEEEFITRFIVPLGAKKDHFGNYHITITEEDGTKSPVLWSSHTDTVHWKEGHQKLIINDQGMLFSDNGSCLGADDGAGVWLMSRMIKAKVPGLYIFHRQEEIGGHGSRFIANLSRDVRKKKDLLEVVKGEEQRDVIQSFLTNHSDPLEGIKYAIAFDRKDICSVITHQGMRCCSDVFADSLIEELRDTGYVDDKGEYKTEINLKKDTGGTFTDTANYTSLIPECTNLSVGYYSQHTRNERLDTVWIKKLLNSLLQFDWRNLVESRKTTDVEYRSYNYGRNYPYSNFGYDGYEYEDGEGATGSTTNKDFWHGSRRSNDNDVNDPTKWVYFLVKNHPGIITEILEEFGFDYETLEMEIKGRGGKV